MEATTTTAAERQRNLMMRGHVEEPRAGPITSRTWRQMVTRGKALAVTEGVPGAITMLLTERQMRTVDKRTEVELIACLFQAIAPNGGLREALLAQGLGTVMPIPAKPKLGAEVIRVAAVPRIAPPILSGWVYLRDFSDLLNQPRRHAAANRIHGTPPAPPAPAIVSARLIKREAAPNTLPSDRPREPVQGVKTSAALVEDLANPATPWEPASPELPLPYGYPKPDPRYEKFDAALKANVPAPSARSAAFQALKAAINAQRI